MFLFNNDFAIVYHWFSGAIKELLLRKILVVNYSQTGQLTRIVDAILGPLQNDTSVQIDFHTIEPEVAFPFPWSFFSFFQVMPESVYMTPIALTNEPNALEEFSQYDLIILSYQVWFLSPSLPISSFLQSSFAKKVFKNTPVMTVIGCRGMWLIAQDKVKALLEKLQAPLVDNIVLTDDCGAGFSFLATPLWMLSGKKKSVSWIPRAGVSDDDIAHSERFGLALKFRLNQDKKPINSSMMQGLQAVKINEKMIISEKIGHRSFKAWGKILKCLGPQNSLRRHVGLCFYFTFLFILIITIVPVNALIIKIFSPLFRNKISKQKAYYAQPSGEK